MSSGRKALVESLAPLICPWPNKRAYDTQAEAEDSLLFMATHPDFEAGQGENVFPCPAGHFHVGRKKPGHKKTTRRRRRR